MPKLLVDLDRTLFDTPTFVQALWEWIGQTYQIDAQAARNDMRAHFSYVEDMYSYDFFAHIAEIGIDKADLIKRAREHFANTTFLYDDAPDFLTHTAEFDRAILTFGEQTHQQFKLMFCPELDDIPIHHTMRPKREYIEEHWPGEPVTLIDDKLLVGKLPETTRFIHVDHEQERPVIKHDGYISVNSLASIQKEWLQ